MPAIVVTGATSGIGREVARRLAATGANVVALGRDARRGRELLAWAESRRYRVTFIACDLSTATGVARAISETSNAANSIDVLVNGAGVFPRTRTVTDDGLELNFAVNHLAPFQMTTGLLDLMPKGARIVNINSAGHFAPIVGTGTVEIDFDDLQFTRNFNPYMAYSRSKLANLLFSYELDRRRGEHLHVNAVHPGLVRSRMARDFPRWQTALIAAMAISPKAGSEPVLALITAPSPTQGLYYDRFTPTTSSPQSQDTGTAARLWAISESFGRN
jgi:NAD(P)-dependent dehydrogenase (short-subunit alcohol dehydrogenase family)